MSNNIHIIHESNINQIWSNNSGQTFSITTFMVILTLLKPGNDKLSLIKIVKDITGYGLKDSKDIVDNIMVTPQIIKFAASNNDAKRIRKYLTECDGLEFTMTDIETIRDRKLLQLGIADHKDYVEELANQDIIEMYSCNFNQNTIKDILIKRYQYLTDDQLRKELKFD